MCLRTCVWMSSGHYGTQPFVTLPYVGRYTMGWLRLVGSLKLEVSFAKEAYKRDDILQKRPMILRSLLIVATPHRINCYTTLQFATLPHDAIHYLIHRYTTPQFAPSCPFYRSKETYISCSVLQCVALCCSVSQCVAEPRNS